jgi:hypothetical protein
MLQNRGVLEGEKELKSVFKKCHVTMVDYSLKCNEMNLKGTNTISYLKFWETGYITLVNFLKRTGIGFYI